MTRSQLLQHLQDNDLLSNPLISAAFRAIDRANFVRPDYLVEAYEDYPLPIGEGQTISQPTTVVFMLELLDPIPGQKILDVGSGSGWTTALLAHIVGHEGQVTGLELLSDLVDFGIENLSKYKFAHARIEQVEKGIFGKPSEAPFDRILVSAAADTLPEDLVAQLKNGGIMVVPIRDSIWRIVKKETGEVEKKKYEGFAFVPLIK